MRTSLLWLSLVLLARPALAQMGDPTKVNLRVAPVAGGVSMIDGADGFAGGNVAVLDGPDGVILVDDELQPMTAKLKAIVATVSKKPVRFVLNTHWHGDHTGNNAAFGGSGALIVAHDNVRKRLSTEQVVAMMGNKVIPPSPPAALPVVTFAEDVTLHLDGETIHAIHVPPAHTDGDVVIKFEKANVLHAGDVLTASFPIIDISSGGTYDGFILAADRMLALTDAGTKIIPGHGPVMSRADLEAWRAMLVDLRTKVAKLMVQKKTADQIKAIKPTAAYDAKFGGGFMKPDMFVDVMVKSITDPKKSPVKK